MNLVKNGIIGFCIGDAMGVPVEFKSREFLLEHPVTKMIGFQTHYVPSGTWSDDTSMTLCLMKSLLDKQDFDYDDIMNNFCKWLLNGEFTAIGIVFDVGQTCYQSIKNYQENHIPATSCGLTTIESNGNGSLMRILPVAYYAFYRKLNETQIYTLVKNVSSLTHGHEISILGCYIYVHYVIRLLEKKDKYASYNLIKLVDYSMFSESSLKLYDGILKGDIKKRPIDEIKSSGYIIDTLEAALWVTLNANDFQEAIIGAINLGDDTDTIGAITGSLAGIIYGYETIPKTWLAKLRKKDEIEQLCSEFQKMLER